MVLVRHVRNVERCDRSSQFSRCIASNRKRTVLISLTRRKCVLTRSVAHGSVKGSSENTNVERLVRCREAFDMLKMAECRDAGE